jgi:hypothetical protein
MPVHAETFSYPLPKELKSQWFNLGHYDKNGHSDIINEDFFISPQGKDNPKAEYNAFVKTLKEYVKDGSNKDILCKFPARMSLLETNLKWFNRDNRPKCDDYIETVNPEKIKSVSLIFASGYFDNPASYYGHTLLRFNYDNTILNQKTLDSSLNYGADITNDEGTLLYIVNGMFGGYSASYQRNNDFIHSNRYTNGQLRDLWEYELNLTPTQTKFVAEHGWEMMNAKFDYYFFNDNCAHRIINLIERATSSDLKNSHGFWLLPIQVVQAAKSYKNNGKSLIKNETYHPSLKSTFSKRYNNLSKAQKNLFIEYFQTQAGKKDEILSKLSEEEMFLILDQLDIQVAKLTIEENMNDDEKKSLEKERGIILDELLKRPSIKYREKLKWGENYTLLDYRPTSVLRSGYTNRNGKNNLTVRYQIANNDLLNKPMAGQESSRFIMGAVEADISDDDIQIRDFTIADITNLNTNALPMSLTNEFSWQVKIGYGHRNRVCDSCGSFGVTTKAGKTIKLNDNTLLYGLVGGRFNSKKTDGYKYVTAVSENGILLDMEEMGKLNIGLDFNMDVDRGEPEYIVKSDYSINITPNSDIRIEAESDFEGNSMFAIKMGYFFN